MKTLDEQTTCVKREIALRRRVYARLVLESKMTPLSAEHEILCMQAVLESLQKLQPTLL